MNKLLVSLLLTLGVSAAAHAADAIVGDAKAGQAKTAVCGACHGPDGNSAAPNFPKLAGQGERYLLDESEMHDRAMTPAEVDAAISDFINSVKSKQKVN